MASPAHLPKSFQSRKSSILSALSSPAATYTDRSPKGSVDVDVRDLIEQINRRDGLVTTSSCSGRACVFVEGGDDGGKAGGGGWTFVSHEPIYPDGDDGSSRDNYWTRLFGLRPLQSGDHADEVGILRNYARERVEPGRENGASRLRLIHLTFEPMILHVLAASLHHAKPVLAAAVAAGFRESGVQSLKNLEDIEACPVLAVRTTGVGFQTVVGVVGEVEAVSSEKEPIYQAVVREEYLRMCVEIINERFEENRRRKERFEQELVKALDRQGLKNGALGKEDTVSRKERKREEGLLKQRLDALKHVDTRDVEDDLIVEDIAKFIPR